MSLILSPSLSSIPPPRCHSFANANSATFQQSVPKPNTPNPALDWLPSIAWASSTETQLFGAKLDGLWAGPPLPRQSVCGEDLRLDEIFRRSANN